MFDKIKREIRRRKVEKEEAADIITEFRVAKSADGFSDIIYVKTTKSNGTWRELHRTYDSDSISKITKDGLKGDPFAKTSRLLYMDKLMYNAIGEVEALIKRFLVEGDPDSFITEPYAVRDKKHSNINIDVADTTNWPGLELTRQEVMKYLYPYGRLEQERVDALRDSPVGIDVSVGSRQYIEVYRHGYNPRRLYLN